jgi:hypothetical protein
MPNNEQSGNRRGNEDPQRQNRQNQQDQQRSPGSDQSDGSGRQAGTGLPEGEKIGEWSDDEAEKSGSQE